MGSVNKVFVALFLLLLLPLSSALEYDGEKVYVNESQVYISAEPHTITKSGYVDFEVMKENYTGNITVLLGFNNSIISPISIQYYEPHNITTNDEFTCSDNFTINTNDSTFRCEDNFGNLIFEANYDSVNQTTKTAYLSTTYSYDWKTIENTQKINYSYDNKYYWDYVTNIPIIAGETKKLRAYFKSPQVPIGSTFEETYPDFDGKYDVAVMPSSYTIDNNGLEQANNNSEFYVLDPTVSFQGNLEAYFNFNNNVNDSSGNGYHGELLGGATYTNNSIIGSAVEFILGADKVRMGTDGSLDFGLVNDDFTVAGWFKFDDVNAGFNQQLFGHRQVDLLGWFLSKDAGTTNLRWQFANGGTPRFTRATANITSGTYHFIVATANKSGDGLGRLYIDGVEVSSYLQQDNMAIAWTSNVRMHVGGKSYTSGDNMDGSADEVSVWNKALSLAEIQELYNGGLGNDPTAAACTEDWVCNGYDSGICLINDTNTASCNSVIDNNACGTNYTGDYTEFTNQTTACDFCTPSFSCGAYGACSLEENTTFTYTRECIGATDDNSCFSQTGLGSDQYAGNLSEFEDQVCQPSDTIAINNASIIMLALVPLMFVLAAFGATKFGNKLLEKGRVRTAAGFTIGFILLVLLLALI